MESRIKVEIKAISNLFIGGAPTAFEIGGIDQITATRDGKPYIPASTIKGALRNIVREADDKEKEAIEGLYKDYIQKEKEKYAGNDEVLKKLDARLALPLTAEALFGLAGLNNTPKLLFGDFLVKDTAVNRAVCFSIDEKTAIDADTAISNPRSYKTARAGLVFAGEIILHKIDDLGESAVEKCRKFIIKNLEKFNDGIYRIGNSKSRGYGQIEVEIIGEAEEQQHENIQD